MIRYRGVFLSDGPGLSANFLSYLDELNENPTLGLVLRKTRPSAGEELTWFGHYYNDIEKGNIVATIAAAEDGEPIGVCDVERQAPGSYISHKGELGLAVRKEYRGKGIGTELLRRTLDKCRGKFDIIQLRVFTTNPARRLYERFGFEYYGHDPFGVFRNGTYFEEELMHLKLPA
jgi:RimJ/RimL family protein N-acetyltransferase